MSASVFIEGIKPPDDKWKKMYAIFLACQEAGVDAPREVQEFFDYETPDPAGVVVEKRKLGDAVREYKEDMREGFEVNLNSLDKDLKVLRFYVGY